MKDCTTVVGRHCCCVCDELTTETPQPPYYTTKPFYTTPAPRPPYYTTKPYNPYDTTPRYLKKFGDKEFSSNTKEADSNHRTSAAEWTMPKIYFGLVMCLAGAVSGVGFVIIKVRRNFGMIAPASSTGRQDFLGIDEEVSEETVPVLHDVEQE
jgi:hypothetical protein